MKLQEADMKLQEVASRWTCVEKTQRDFNGKNRLVERRYMIGTNDETSTALSKGRATDVTCVRRSASVCFGLLEDADSLEGMLRSAGLLSGYTGLQEFYEQLNLYAHIGLAVGAAVYEVAFGVRSNHFSFGLVSFFLSHILLSGFAYTVMYLKQGRIQNKHVLYGVYVPFVVNTVCVMVHADVNYVLITITLILSFAIPTAFDSLRTIFASKKANESRLNRHNLIKLLDSKTSNSAIFDNIQQKIDLFGHHLNVDTVEIAQEVFTAMYSNIKTVELEELAQSAAKLSSKHPHYGTLATRISVFLLYAQTQERFSEVMQNLHDNVNDRTNRHEPLISDATFEIVMNNADILNHVIKHDRDNDLPYFGFKTLERSHLLKKNGKIVERPQHMFMRVAIGIHGEDIEAVLETYDLMSALWFMHATPTLLNAGTTRPQLVSSFLLTLSQGSSDGIFNAFQQCNQLSKSADGMGVNVQKIRAAGIRGPTDGVSLVPLLHIFNNAARFIKQSIIRPGTIAVYLEPWHADVFEVLDLNRDTGSDKACARDLSYALWIPDLFMKRVQTNGKWSLMCPHECPGLEDCWGEKFEALYTKYESEKRYRRQVRACDLWNHIVGAQIETGTPYMVYKDACNRKSNQQNLGTIKGSSVCTGIVEYSASDETAVSNLASIALNRFVDPNHEFDFNKLKAVTKTVTKNLNKIIDINYYPVPEAEKSNKRHRPISIGVQGLADTFQLMRLPYTSKRARQVNKQIFETIYYGALEASAELAGTYGVYETYEGSPVSKGILQHDMWNVTPTNLWDWTPLRSLIQNNGVRNSLLVAVMPDASTAEILGINESIEPYADNVFTHRVLSDTFRIVNPHLLKDLIQLNLWNEDTESRLVAANGSVQNIRGIPSEIKERYKTAYEIRLKDLVGMAADRGAFIDQSQSLNFNLSDDASTRCASMHLCAWKKGLKTGMYKLRPVSSNMPN
uniref:Ribonucleoside-diphosphate reductase n=1 Tax=Panagrellus redivivus TaxID=6233 RepID=A0A7E4W9P5_PANRE